MSYQFTPTHSKKRAKNVSDLPNLLINCLIPAVLQQQTIKAPIKISGIGLHSGNKVSMTILPAPAGTGIRFVRTDLDGRPEVEASINNVVETSRSTTLGKGNVRIFTVEHVLSALSGMGVHNSVIELDSNEPPICDGSSSLFAKEIEKVGIELQQDLIDPIIITDPVKIESSETIITAFPYDRLKITCVSSGRNGRFTQLASFEITPETWYKEISKARTFCYFEEIEHLIRNGLIKGGTLENAVVIREDAVLTTEPLRYPDEFVRHKILDLIGDLALLQRPIQAHIIAIRPSHNANCELVRRLVQISTRQVFLAKSFAPPPLDYQPQNQSDQTIKTEEKISLQDGEGIDHLKLMKIIPHRYPFIMIDRVKKVEGNKITAIKNVTLNEPFFQGHFPSYPIFPGVLQLEAIAQTAGILMLRQAENLGKLAYFMSAENVKWRKPVFPGDTLVIEIELIRSKGKIGRAHGTCSVDNEIVSEAEVTFMLVDQQKAGK